MTSPLAADVLLRGNADWVHLAEVKWVVKSIGGERAKDRVIESSLDVIRELLESRLADIGDVTDGGFFEWNLPIEDAIKRVRGDWVKLDQELRPGDVCWLANTAAGNKLAEEIFRQREAQSDL